ncbi:MAG: discoidin domain-containing protein [Fibrobacterales bacterium]
MKLSLLLTVAAVLGCASFASAGYINIDKSSQKIHGITATAPLGSESGYPAENVIDGDMSTRWASNFADNQELILDLQQEILVHKIVLAWENAYATNYQVSRSVDGVTWEDTYYQGRTGTGGIEVLEYMFGNARYIKLKLNTRATQYGFSLYEVEVFTQEIAPKAVRLQGISDRDRPECNYRTAGQMINYTPYIGSHNFVNYIQVCVGESDPGPNPNFGWVTIASPSMIE